MGQIFPVLLLCFRTESPHQNATLLVCGGAIKPLPAPKYKESGKCLSTCNGTVKSDIIKSSVYTGKYIAGQTTKWLIKRENLDS